MTPIYIALLCILVIAVVVDIVFLSPKNKDTNRKKAIFITCFWVLISSLFSLYILKTFGNYNFLKYVSSYLLEWSLSLDNIFVFILIFRSINIHRTDAGNALLYGILMAIIFRIVFISVGVQIIEQFYWILYIFGAILVYMGLKVFFKKPEDDDENIKESKTERIVRKYLRLSNTYHEGKYTIKIDNKLYFTPLTLAVILLGLTDIVFAFDSIPTVMSLIREDVSMPFTDVDRLIIYASNIFAILGLRALYFILKSSINALPMLNKSISILLIFIGSKMLLEIVGVHINIVISFVVMFSTLLIGVLWSVLLNSKRRSKTNK